MQSVQKYHIVNTQGIVPILIIISSELFRFPQLFFFLKEFRIGLQYTNMSHIHYGVL